MQSSSEKGETVGVLGALLLVSPFSLDSHPCSLQPVSSPLGEPALACDSPGSHPGFATQALGNFLKRLHFDFFIYKVKVFIALFRQRYSKMQMSDRVVTEYN